MLGVFLNENVQGYSFSHPTKYKPTKQEIWCTRSLHATVWNSVRLDYSELSVHTAKDVKAEYLAKETGKKSRFLAN